MSMVEESSTSASVMDEEEDGGDYDIQDLADAISSSPAGAMPATPMRSPSPKKKRKYKIGDHSEKVGGNSCRQNTINQHLSDLLAVRPRHAILERSRQVPGKAAVTAESYVLD